MDVILLENIRNLGKIGEVIKSQPGDPFIFITHTQNAKTDPLSFEEKQAYIQQFYPNLVVGDALDSATQIGPVVDEKQLQQNVDYVKLAADEGCDVRGGSIQNGPGFFQKPAVFASATNDMRVSREEIFGPCASVIKAVDYDEALHLANDTDFGLSAGICTTSLKYATDFRKKSKAGMVMVNLPTAGVDYHVPFGGRKGSSYGPREQGGYAREFYTIVKTSYISA